jgi:two-component system, cell cycle sensor histidine kinase and response regulator CckA
MKKQDKSNEEPVSELEELSQSFPPDLRKSEERYRNIIEAIEDGYYEVDIKGNSTFFNNSYCEIMGYPGGELPGMNYRNYMDEPTAKKTYEVFNGVYRTGKAVKVYDYEIIRKDGTTRTCSISVSLMKNDEGQPCGFRGILRDITDLKRAEEALRESEERYRDMVESIEDLICTHDLQGKLLFVNQAPAKVLGYAPDELVGTDLRCYLAPEVRHQFEAYLAAIQSDGHASGLMFVQTKSGEKRIWEYRNRLSIEGPGAPVVHGLARDITERQKAETAMRQQRDFLQQLIDAIPTPIFYKDVDGRYMGCNRAFESDMGISRADIVGKTVFDVHASDLAQIYHEQDLSLLRHPGVQQGETSRQDAAGNMHEVMFTKATFSDLEGNIAGLVGVILDITERKRVEEALQESEQRYEAFLNSTTDLAFLKDEAFRYVMVNKANQEFFGKAEIEIIGKTDFELMPLIAAESCRQSDFEAIESEGTVIAEEEFGGRIFETKKFAVDLGNGQKGVGGLIRDITDRKKAEEELRVRDSAIMTTLNGISFANPDGTILYVNSAFAKMWGFEEPHDALGLHISDFCDDEEALRAFAEFQERGYYSGEIRARKKDGTPFHLQMSANSVFDDNGKPLVAMASFVDITNRKQTEEALRESEERYRTLVENIGVGISLIDSKNNIVMSNSTIGKWFDVPASDLSGKKCFQAFRRRDTVCPNCHGAVAMTTGHVAECETENPRADGALAHVHIQAFPLLEPDGIPKGFIEVVTDVTERKKTEEALRKSQEMLKLALRGADLGLWDLNLQTGQGAVNQQTANMAGYSLDEIDPTLNGLLSLVHSDDRPSVMSSLDNHVSDRTASYEAEFRILTKSGDWKWILSRGKVAERGEDGSPQRMAGTFMDVTERKRREDQIKFSNILLSAQQEASPDGILVIDDNGKILLSNKRFADMWGIPSQVIEKKSDELALQSVLDKLEYPQKFLDGVNYLYAHRDETSRDEIALKDGRFFDRYSAPMVASDGTHYGRVWYFRDVTEEKTLQKQLLQAQKMEAVGTLSGGIAHDFNNLLTVVMGFSELLLAEKEQGHPEYADLKKIFHAAQNGAELVKRLLMFSRKSEPKPVPMNLNKQIVEVEKLLRRTIPRMVKIDLTLSPDLPAINADPSQVEQILMNLAVNARDAMPEVGKLTVVVFHIKWTGFF